MFVLRPSRFIQRTIADIGIKLYRDDFKMKVPVSMHFFGPCVLISMPAVLRRQQFLMTQ